MLPSTDQGLRGNPVNSSNIWSHERRSTYFIIRYISIYETRIMYPMKKNSFFMKIGIVQHHAVQWKPIALSPAELQGFEW